MGNRRRTWTLRLIRTGETIWAADSRVHGQTDLPLSEAGRASVRVAAEHLGAARLGTVIHPSDEAATETASIICQAAKARRRSIDGLADPDLGLLEGLTLEAIAERYPRRFKQWRDEPLALHPPEGEPFIAARARAAGAVVKALRRSRSGRLTAIVHPINWGLVAAALARRDSGHMWSMIEQRPLVETYLLHAGSIDRLETIAADRGLVEA